MPSQLGLPFGLLRKSQAEAASGFVPLSLPPATGPYIFDRVKETTTSTGAGPFVLLGAATNYQSFAVVGDGNSTYYCIEDGANWEVVLGTYTLATASLSVTAVLRSSAANGVSAITFGAGTKNVFCVDPAVILSPTNTQFNVKAFGAKGDVQTVADGNMTAGSAILTSPTGLFASADVGKFISVKLVGVQGNNGGVANYLTTTIASYQSATQVTLSANATNTNSGAEVWWGTDDAVAINAAMFAASIKGGIVYIPPSIYFVGSEIIWYTHTHIVGSGIDTSVLMLAPGATCDIIQGKGWQSLTGTNTQAGIYACSIQNLSINGFYYHGGFKHTQVSAAATTYDTTLNVISTTGFPPSGKLLVYDNFQNLPGEIIAYTGLTTTSFTGLTRARDNTVSQAFQGPGVGGGESVDLRTSITNGVVQGGFGIRVYGYGYVLLNVRIHDCEQDGLCSEWTTITGTIAPDDCMAHITNLISHTSNGHGVWFNGPHDSSLIDMQIYSNSMIGIRVGPTAASGVRVANTHCFGKQNYSYSLEAFCCLHNCVGEQGIGGQAYVNASQIQIIGCHFFASPSQIFTRGVVMGAANPAYCVIDCEILDCNQGSIDFTGDGGNNYYRLQIRQQGGGNVFIGAPAASSNTTITELPGNYNALTGENAQIGAPVIFRSLQPGTQTIIVRSPTNQTSNIFEAQNNAAGGTALTVIDKNGMFGIRQGTPTFGLHQIGGSQRLAALGTPATPTGTAFGGSGTNADYFIVAEDIAGNKTLATAKVSISGGAALSATVWNRVTWTALAGAIKYYILKTNTATQLATFSPSIGGIVSIVSVMAGGSGYTGAAPAIGFNGPPQNGPQFTATVAGNLVTGISVNTGQFGTGFTSVPTVVIGGPGSGATATAVMGVSNLSTIGAGGSGYAINDTITLTGGTFTTAAVLKVTGVSAGAVTSVAIQTMGNYSVLPANPVAQGSTTGQGVSGTFNVLWGISALTVTNGGTGYSSAPAVGVNGGGFYPTCGVVLAANAVSGISVSGGAGLTGAPTVVVGGVAAGSGATASASISTTSYDDIGGGTSAFTTTLRDATADATFDGNVIMTAAAAIGVGTMGVTTTAVSSTTTAETKSLIGTIVGTFTCPVNFMVVGRKLRFSGHGNLTTGITASTIDFQIFFAGTKIASTGALAPTVSLSNKYFEWELEIVCITVGSSGTFFCQGKVSILNAITGTAAMETWPLLGNNATPPAAVTVDTTASSLLDFKTVTGNNLHTVTNNPGTSLEVMN